MKTEKIEQAKTFATLAHGEQKRKYTGDPYIVHPAEVAFILATVGADENMIIAGWLHDTVEDTQATNEEIRELFGDDVAELVHYVTDVSRPEDGNRKLRKSMDRDHVASGTPRSKSVKLADMISNTSSIVQYAPGFAVKYMAEKRDLLNVIGEVSHPKLLDMAWGLVNDYFKDR